MTREEAILILKELWKYEHVEYEDCEVRKALDMAIEALAQEPCEDCISRAFLIDRLLEKVKTHRSTIEIVDKLIPLIKELPSVNPQEPKTDEDCISRQAAISVIEALQKPIMREASDYYQFKFSGMSEAREVVVNLPSVTPIEPTKTGHWIKSDIPNEEYVCSECGGACWYYDYEAVVAKSRFCPNCGAKMEG